MFWPFFLRSRQISHLCFGSKSWICNKVLSGNYNIVLNINWFPKQAGCSASPRSKKVPLWRAEAARGSVSSVWRPLRDERHEESYDERPRGGQEARVGGAVRILRSFLPAFPIVVRAVVHHSFLQGKKTTYEQSIRRAAAGLTLTYAALF